MIDPTDDFFKKVVEHFGYDAQLNKLKEELFELGVAICHWQEKKVTNEELVSEIADVMILCKQIVIYYDFLNNLFNEAYEEKLKRLADRTNLAYFLQYSPLKSVFESLQKPNE